MRVFQYQHQYKSKLKETTLLDFRFPEIRFALIDFWFEECTDKNLHDRLLQQTVALNWLEMANHHPNLRYFEMVSSQWINLLQSDSLKFQPTSRTNRQENRTSPGDWSGQEAVDI